jgi:hypothetical protein
MVFVLAGAGENAHGVGNGKHLPHSGRADFGDALFYDPDL